MKLNIVETHYIYLFLLFKLNFRQQRKNLSGIFIRDFASSDVHDNAADSLLEKMHKRFPTERTGSQVSSHLLQETAGQFHILLLIQQINKLLESRFR